MTQAGLGGMTAAGPKTSYGRTVQDESYHVGLLRGKIQELTAEIARLKQEVKTLERDQSSYQSYEKRAEALAAEIKISQGELADLNLMSEQLDHHVEVSEVLADMEDLKAKNDRESRDIDDIFAARSKVDADTKGVEQQIEAEKAKKEDLVQELNPDQRDAYERMNAENHSMGQEIEQMTQELDVLHQRANEFDNELRQNPIKREAIKLHEQIQQMELKHSTLKEEIEAEKKTSPEEQRQKLLETVRNDNQEIAGINHKITQITSRISDIENEITDLDRDEEDDKMDERREKYNELLEREREMKSYLETFDDNFNDETQRMEAFESKIVELMEEISQDTERSGQLPSMMDVASDQKHLQIKQGELSKAEMTAKSLQHKRAQLQNYHANVNQLDSKIKGDLKEVKDKIKMMKDGLIVYEDIAGLKESKEAYKKRLVADKKLLVMRREITKRATSEKGAHYEKAKKELSANETFSQLQVLEKKWQQHAKSNYTMQQFIRTKQMESHYKPYVARVNVLLKEYNTHLKGRPTQVKPGIAT